jgi:hypothetical protein
MVDLWRNEWSQEIAWCGDVDISKDRFTSKFLQLFKKKSLADIMESWEMLQLCFGDRVTSEGMVKQRNTHTARSFFLYFILCCCPSKT